MSAVTLDQLGKEYAGTSVLSDISVSFPVDSVTAVIGRSGSGKSTLLRTINGLVRPDRGSVQVMGEAIDYTELPALRRQIGYAVQGAGLFPHLDVAANITLCARLQDWDEHDAHLATAKTDDPRRSAPDWRGPCCSIPAYCCWTSPLPRWIR